MTRDEWHAACVAWSADIEAFRDDVAKAHNGWRPVMIVPEMFPFVLQSRAFELKQREAELLSIGRTFQLGDMVGLPAR